MQEALITSRIKAVLPDAEITLTTFDGVHYSAHIRSAGFAGKSRLEQHRTVMNALGDILGSNEIHALALKTELAGETPLKTPPCAREFQCLACAEPSPSLAGCASTRSGGGLGRGECEDSRSNRS